MRKRIIPFLKCPSSGKTGLVVFAFEALRNNDLLKNLSHDDLHNEDDIITGILIHEQSGIVYPIRESVAVLLAFSDVDPFHHITFLESLKSECPEKYLGMLNNTIAAITNSRDTTDGSWNRDEMRYYDAAVETSEKRSQMFETIKKIPVHRILIPREKHIIKIIAPVISGSMVLEIGCGNASTIYRICKPATHNFSYIGTDISFKRLLVAKMAIPEGDFIQASALNLPFITECFSAVISFGMLHHLPRPVDAVAQVMPLIKANGMFGFHEPVIRKTLNFPGATIIKKAMATYEHSEHDGKIDLNSTLQLLKNSGFKIIHTSGQISQLRSILETTIKRINKNIMLHKPVVLIFEKADKVLIHFMSKLSIKVRPKAIFIVAQK